VTGITDRFDHGSFRNQDGHIFHGVKIEKEVVVINPLKCRFRHLANTIYACIFVSLFQASSFTLKNKNMTLQKITPFLWFDNQAEEAAKFYVSLFNNSKIINLSP